VRLTPGTAIPARLSRLAIAPLKPPSVTYEPPGVGAFTDSFGTVLSASGHQLAVPEWTGPHELLVKVFSVATGQLLHEWTTSDPAAIQQPSLAWIDGDRELALVGRGTSVSTKFAIDTVTVREWPVAGTANGDLAADSKVVWSMQTGNGKSSPHPTTVQGCVEPVVGGPVLISADGKTFSCTTAGGSGSTDHVAFHTYPLAASTTATAPGTDYQVTYTGEGLYIPQVLWTSASGGTIIGALFPYVGGSPVATNGLRIGVISDGKFTPLKVPESLATSPSMAF
jgi:hypothetical protein